MQTHARRGSDHVPGPAGTPRGRSTTTHSEAAPDAPLSAEGVLDLQASAGNQAVVQRLNVQREIGWGQADRLARQLDDAMSGPGTDEEAVYGALTGRTPDDMKDIRDAYKQITGGKTLDVEVRDELNDDEYARVRAVLEARDDRTQSAGDRQAAAMDRAAAIADQLHDAMEGLGTEEDQIFNALTGRTPVEIQEIVRQYAARYPHTLEYDLRDDLSGSDLARALELIGRTDAGRFENMQMQHMTEGATTIVRGRFEWTLTEDKLDVQVPVHFQPDEGVTVPLDLWNGQIFNTWNLFWIKESGGRRIDLRMSLRNDSSDARKIKVIENTKPGEYDYPDRANAGKWYPVMPEDTAPHEFGHLIGLPDEYQRTREDFETITGQTKTGPENTSGKTEAAIATELNTALTSDPVDERPAKASRVLRSVGLIASGRPQQGDFAQKVMTEYDKANTPHLLPALQGLPEGTNWTLLTVFSYASGTTMGNPGVVGITEHEHPVEPRHLREFTAIVANRWPGLDWHAE
jgi:hypothetical protein